MSDVLSDDEVLNKAACIIRDKGLAKRQFVDSITGSCCIMGALRQAICGENGTLSDDEAGFEQYIRARALVSDALCGAKFKDDWKVVALWNDAPERTAEDVIAVLERAAKNV